MPEVGGRVDWYAEDHEQTMLALGLSSKREITRTRIRVRTAMATQTREQGRYLGVVRRTGTGSLTPGRTRTRPTPPGDAVRTSWNRTRQPRQSSGGCSASGWPSVRSTAAASATARSAMVAAGQDAGAPMAMNMLELLHAAVGLASALGELTQSE